MSSNTNNMTSFRMIRRQLCIILFLLLFILMKTSFSFGQEENLNVFNQWIIWNNSGGLLIHHLLKQASYYYDLRDQEISKLKTKTDWLKRQEKVKELLMEIVGPFSEKTPLNPTCMLLDAFLFPMESLGKDRQF